MSGVLKIITICFVGALLLGLAFFIAPKFISFSVGNDAGSEREVLKPILEEAVEVHDAPVGAPTGLPVVGNGTVIDSFKDCERAGYPIMESYPRQCRANGMLFVEQVTASSAPPTEVPVACTLEAKICPDGSSVGRTGPDCVFEACPGQGDGVPAADVHVCTEEEKQAQVCTMEYVPVCGLVAVQCVAEPCEPVPQTFGNGCGACAAENVTSYTEGACVE